PKPLSAAQLEDRGSWRAKERRRQEIESAEGYEPPTRPKREIPPDVAPESLIDIIKILPGYDPYWRADDYYFDAPLGARAVNFFQQRLAHVKGELAGQAFRLEDWEQAIVANLFGWLHKETGYRRYRQAFIEVGRKNGKTPLAAGIILYLLFEDREPGAEIYGAAAEYKQASLVFTHAWGMRNQEPYLSERSKVFKGQSKSIEIGEPGDLDYGVYRVISSDSLTAHGFLMHGGVVDELHTQPNSELVDALTTSMASRRQPLLVYITTSDFEREGSICNEKEDHALRVLDEKDDTTDPSFLPVVYQASIDDDWTDPEVWKKANPNLGVSVRWDYLKSACEKAKENPRYENTFKRLHLNIRTEQDVRWFAMDRWDACGESFNPEILKGQLCYGGLDMSSTTDITAFVLVFPLDDLVYVLPYFWLPKENARKRQDRDRVPYLDWAKRGLITLTEGDVVDYDVVRRDINALGEIYNIKDVGVDRWNATQITTQLGGDGFEIFPFGQGYASMSGPSKELEKLIIQGGLRHGGHSAVLRWMASNVSVEQDAAGNIKPSKKKSTERIDGIVSLIEAIGRMIAEPPPRPSVYEERGVLAF
ncbi:MAG: terminase large subunit, partial [Planctomycetota bacterium]